MARINNAVTPNGEPLFLQYLHARGKTLGFPVSVTFELTSRCNFQCRMCYIHTQEDNACAGQELSAAQWLDIGRQARDAGVMTVLLTGGEPLLRKDFPEIFSGLKKLGLLVSVNTNGSLLSGDLAELFINDPPERLNVSLYGASEETYEALCGRACCGEVLTNIKNMTSAGVQVRLNISVTPQNKNNLEAMLETAKALGVHCKVTTYMYPPVRRISPAFGENPARFSPEEAAFYRVKYDLLRLGKEGFLRRAASVSENGVGEMAECADPSQEGEAIRCRAGTSACWINARGELSACGMFSLHPHNVPVLGFAACWEEAKKETALLRTPPECVNCVLKNLCPACAAVCYAETGGFAKAPRYACEFSRASAKYIAETAERLQHGD